MNKPRQMNKYLNSWIYKWSQAFTKLSIEKSAPKMPFFGFFWIQASLFGSSASHQATSCIICMCICICICILFVCVFYLYICICICIARQATASWAPPKPCSCPRLITQVGRGSLGEYTQTKILGYSI